MLKFFFTIATLLLINVDSSAANSTSLDPKSEALQPEIVTSPAKIRGDGVLVDDDGLIIGIRNLYDSRNSEQIFFFYGVNEAGEVSAESKYAVYQNPDVTWPDFVMQTLYPEPKDYQDSIGESQLNSNRLFFEDDKLFFNGQMYESGAVISGGIAVVKDGKLFYNGQEVQEGAFVSNGNIGR